MLSFIMLLVSVALGACGQFLFRLGMKTYGQVSAFGAFRQIINIVFTPAVFIGFILFGLSSILWLSVISKYQLSFAYPMVSMGYIVTMLLSFLFLNEHISLYKILGTMLIMSGVIFITKG